MTIPVTCTERRCQERYFAMLWTIAVILLLLWLFGFMFSVAGNFVHALLVIAAIVVVVRLLQGRKGLT